ncbi:MAG TPA: type II CAAX endopeptidase family protein [Gaiellaceae bacterium]|nr:type II CAAX endopeptidase family protein [Gaiellaceae bacterium]
MPAQPAVSHGRLRLALWLLLVLLLSAAQYAGRSGDGSDLPEDVAYRYDYAAANAVGFAVLLGLVLLIAWGLPKREAFALRRPESWRRALGLVAAGFVSILVLSAALSPFLDAGEEQGLLPEEWDSSRLGPYVAFSVLAVVGAPIVEESMYRGLGFTLAARYGTWAAIVVTAVLFGAAHGLVAGLPVLVVFGLLLAYLRARTSSIFPCMLLHAAFNLVGVLSVPLLAGANGP